MPFAVCCGRAAHRGQATRARGAVTVFRVPRLTGQTGAVTREQLEMISADAQVRQRRAVIAGPGVRGAVTVACLAAGMTAEQIPAESPTVAVTGVRAAAAYGAALAREELLPIPQPR